MADDRSDRIALDPTGRHVAIRAESYDDWFVFDTAAAKGTFSSSLPDGWTRFVPATDRDRLAEEVARFAAEAEGIASGLDWLKRRTILDSGTAPDTANDDASRDVTTSDEGTSA